MKDVDKTLLAIVGLLVLCGFFIFSSAALGQLARSGASFQDVAFSQIVFGIFGGGLALFVAASIHYRHWRQYAFYIFLFSILITLLVFIPNMGYTHGGATRWIDLGFISFQPSELLKIGFIIYIATWLSGTHKQIRSFTKGTLPFYGIVAIPGVILLLQPDTDTFLILAAAATAMFLVAGGRWRDVGIMALVAVVLIASLAMARPYVKERLLSYIDPGADLQGSGYQVNQSLIAIGSGGPFGRGFGQSIQKFEYLPEPISDSIFAVYAEEWGFLGSSLLVLLLAAFSFRGYKIAAQARDLFGMLLVVGIMTLIVAQAFLHVAAMAGVAPMLGLPLPFISHGGTALLVTLGAVGIVLNVSKYRKSKY